LPAFYEEIFGIASRKMNGESGGGKRVLGPPKLWSLAFDTDSRRESLGQLETAWNGALREGTSGSKVFIGFQRYR